MKELPKDEGGDYVEDDETDSDSSDLGEGTSAAGPFGLMERQADGGSAPGGLEPLPERREKVDKELEDDFDRRDFPAYFSDGTLDLRGTRP